MGKDLIIVDWGTTGFRAWLVDEKGGVKDEIPSGIGMRDLPRERFPGYCGEQVARWRSGGEQPPIFMAGMVGAPQGWQAAPQPILPIGLDDLATQVVAAEGLADTWIIPGCRVQRSQSEIDVMRGEEVQIFGALELLGCRDALFCLPGTHSKWAETKDGTLTHFTTSMTGEVYQVMLAHSILGKTADANAPFSPAAFRLGLDQARRDGGVLHHMFTTRCRALYGDLAPETTPSYLSGLLIGSELRSMRILYPKAKDVVVVAGHALTEPYRIALAATGFSTRSVSAKDASLTGIRAVVNRRRACIA